MSKRLLCICALVFVMVLSLIAPVYATQTDAEESPVFEGKLSISDEGIEMIKNIEGCINRPMSDYSQYSIGYGCSTDFAKEHGFSTTYLSEEEAHELLLFVLEGMEKKLDSFLNRYSIAVNQHQYDALMSFTFNLGSNWMSETTRLGEVLVDGHYTINEFASAMGVYCHVTTSDGPEVLDLLVDRRIREIKLFLYGAYDLNDVEEKFCTLRFDAGDAETETDIAFYLVDQPYQILFEAYPPEEAFDTYFVGWYDENGERITADTLAEASTTVYAHWSDEEEDPELYYEDDFYETDLTFRPQKRSVGKDGSSGNDVAPPFVDATEQENVQDEQSDILVEASTVFTDLYQDQWYYRYVNELYNSGVINGYEDSTFRPERTVTTGEALKMIILAAGYEEPPAVESHWARGYLDLALENAILDSGDITDLDIPISRTMMAKIAARALGIERIFDTEPFTDTSNMYAATLSDHGIIEGYEDGSFRPDRSLTRAELSTIVWRINKFYN